MIGMDFKDLKIWQRGMGLLDMVYDLTKDFPKDEVYGLTSQAKRAGVSVPSNIAEGSQRTSSKEFANFILIAKGSLAELETQVLFAKKRKFGSSELAQKILKEIEEISRMLHAFHTKLLE